METFVFMRKALHLFNSIMVFTKLTSRLRQRPSGQCFPSKSIEVQRIRKKADPGIGRMMCLSNYMQPWFQHWDQNDPVELSVHVFCLPPPRVLRFSRKEGEAGELEARKTGDDHASAALPWEDQTWICTWRTWPEFFDFADFERCEVSLKTV